MPLVIELPDAEIDFLKHYAAHNKTTVTNLISQWINSLKTAPQEAEADIHPEIKRFTGIIPGDVDVNEILKRENSPRVAPNT